MNKFAKIFLLPAATALALLATGCGVEPAVDGPVSYPAATGSSGVVMGGQQAVVGSTVQLYAATAAYNTTYGAASTKLGASVTTNSSGSFTLPAITCGKATQQVYLVATGGYPIAAVTGPPAVPATQNTNLALMALIGNCSNVASSVTTINEVTTIAAVWSIAPFMSVASNIAYTNVSADGYNFTGMSNAFATAGKIGYSSANSSAVAGSLPSGAVLPINEINTLADILEQCVNSGGGVASDATGSSPTGCGKLFADTTAGGVTPTDTITAAYQIATNPTLNVSALNSLRSTSPVFQPVLDVNTPPNDWTIAITYTGGGLSSPQGIALDASSNVWVANSGNSSVSEFSATGAAISGTAGITSGGISVPYAIAIDTSGNTWVANYGTSSTTGSITKITAGTGTNYTDSTLQFPSGIAIDSAGYVFVSNYGGTGVSLFNNAGTFQGTYNNSGVTAPIGVALSAK